MRRSPLIGGEAPGPHRRPWVRAAAMTAGLWLALARTSAATVALTAPGSHEQPQ